jgi:porin
MKCRKVVLGIFIWLPLLYWTSELQAGPPPVSAPINNLQSGQTGNPCDFWDGLNHSSQMLGDLCGARTFLARYGMTLGIQETSEVLGNVTGGSQRGADYDGLTQVTLQLDTQHAFNWYGGTFNVSGLQVHGDNLSAENLGSLQTASGIEADRGARLWELWYDQKFLDQDKLDIKIGQQSLDQEFMVSSNALLFVNTMFGWPMVPSADLPGGGPAYPLSDLGVRAQWKTPVDSLKILAGVFNGSPIRNNDAADSQRADRWGTSFPLDGGVLAITELQYSYPALGAMSYGDESPLSGTYRLGAWYDSEQFADQRYDNTGASLADSSTGVARLHNGDYSIYGVVDQMIMRSSTDPNRNLSTFLRVMGTPENDRNFIDFSMNFGFNLTDPLPYRTDDTFGIGMGYTRVSNYAVGLAQDNETDNGGFAPQGRGETFVEATYQYQLYPWMQLQPDVQYVINPGGGIVDPSNPTRTIKNEWVIGIRAIIQI